MTEKKCRWCGETKKISEFYKHKDMFDGYLNKCKICFKKDALEYRLNNIDRIRENDRNRPNHGDRIEKNKEYQRANKEKINSIKSKWGKENKNKLNAHTKTKRLIESNKITRKEYCETCGANGCKIEVHHRDYSNPYDVLFLCIKCHTEEHKRLRDIQRSNK